MELAKPLQDDIVEYYGVTGNYPMTNSDLGLSGAELIQGQQVSSMSVAHGVIEIKFQKDSRIANRIISLQPALIGDSMSGNIIWQYVERAVE
ncbi:MAG: pilin [Desulfobulbaceae bacterium]|nr:pilin [Desulfobulbaceae bacterium]